jgi:DNA-binding MarR family transcriptional regulator
MPAHVDEAQVASTAAKTRVRAAELHSAAVRLLRIARRGDGRAGTGPAQMSVLSLLADREPLSVRELAAAEGVAHATMSRIVASLNAAELVTKMSDRRDRRRQMVELTPLGRAKHQEARGRRQQMTEALVALMKPATVEDLSSALCRLADRLER